jgi:hypothetical protein
MESLRDTLKDWMDVDLAQSRLAIGLGLMPEGIFQVGAKHVFWTANPVGDMLYKMLLQMSEVGILETRNEPDIQFRWNPSFRGSWE